MGDFEDVFGAGADLDRIIARHDRAHARKDREEEKPPAPVPAPARASLYNTDPHPSSPDDARNQCRKAMKARGYEPGPIFTTYADLAAWEKTNTRPHVRMKLGVFFTDASPPTIEEEGFPGDFMWEGKIPY